MARVVTSWTADREQVHQVLEPRRTLVVERAVGAGRFEAVRGPVERYQRAVRIEEVAGSVVRVTQTVDFRLAIPYFGFVFIFPFKRALSRRSPSPSQPWWAPPDPLDARGARALATPAVSRSSPDTSAPSSARQSPSPRMSSGPPKGDRAWRARSSGSGGFSRSPSLPSPTVAVADRSSWQAWPSGVISASGALAPSMAWLTGTQVVGRSLAISLLIVIGIVASEEMPAGSRAYAASLLGISAGGGAGISLVALPLADVAEGGWRLVYAIALLALPLVPGVARRLPDRYLNAERAFSAAQISVFLIATNLPGAVGVVVGGRLADLRGRRPVAAASLAGGTVAAVLFFSSSALALWISSAMWSLIGAASLPALGVYGPELFPTSLRGRANGLLAAVGLAGSGAGLLIAGFVSGATGSFGPAMTLLAAGPLALAILVLIAYPETRQKELEELNPEDGEMKG